MKNNCTIILLFFSILFPILSFAQNESIGFKEQKIAETVTTILHDSHYNPAEINDAFSKAVFHTFLTALDPDKRVFLVSDIKEFKKNETNIDDLIKTNDLTFFNLVYDRVVKRKKESKIIYTALLQKPTNLYVDENINPDDDKLDYTKNHTELKNRWRLQLKYFILKNLGVNLEEAAYEYGAKKPNQKFIELEKSTREALLKKINNDSENIDILTREYFFEKYINAIVVQFDSHSLYMINSKKNQSEINLTGKLVGIGARLVIENELITIGEIAYGGPAFNSKRIDVGDIILKVTEKNNIPFDITGLKLPEVTALMKGNIGTTITLTIKKDDGSIIEVPIKRELIEFKDSYAKSCIVEKNGKKFGIIDLPKFYKDFDDTNNRDAAKDIQNEIEFLKKEGIDGIVMDLRNNGGGAVDTAIDITGLFIETGPIVQIKSAIKTKEILSDMNPKMQWEGPLVVLLNNNSASASEIFAAAIQDYKRGIIMGSKQSYGKGTVQKTTNLDLYIPKGTGRDYGALKTTVKKIYRISGSSTQLEGISSDIVMPDEFLFVKYGERNKSNVMAWDKIEALPFTKWNSHTNFETVIGASNKRIAENRDFQLLNGYAEYLSKKEQNNTVSLNVEKYKLDQNRDKDELNKFDRINNYKNNLIFKSTANELSLIEKTPSLGVKRKEWQDTLINDIYIDEALNVLIDLKNNTIENEKINSKK